MRLPYNKLMDVYTHPGAGGLGPPVAVGVACRLVVSRAIDQVAGVGLGDFTWVTTQGDYYVPAVAVSVDVALVIADYFGSALFAIPTGGPVTHMAVAKQYVADGAEPPYWRYLVQAV